MSAREDEADDLLALAPGCALGWVGEGGWLVALWRIEEFERGVNRRSNDTLLTFQSSHPSSGRYVG